MKKSLVIATLAVFVLMSGFDICQAKTSDSETNKAAAVKTQSTVKDSTTSETAAAEGQVPDRMQPPPNFGGENFKGRMQPPPNFDGRNSGFNAPNNYRQPPFSKDEMDKKKAEFDKRLKLTDEQKKQIEQNRLNDREKIKPIMEQMDKKKQEFNNLEKNTSLSQAEKAKKENELRGEIRDLRIQADNQRKENMKDFESVLTKKQQKEFTKIKKEQKKDMEKRQKQIQKQHKNDCCFGKGAQNGYGHHHPGIPGGYGAPDSGFGGAPSDGFNGAPRR